MKKFIVFTITAAVVVCLVTAGVLYSRHLRILDYYESKVELFNANFRSTLAVYESVFQNVYNDKLNVDEVTTLIHSAIVTPDLQDMYRGELEEYSSAFYDSLQGLGLSHMQYHLPDGTSFLRMHRQFMYGDNLTGFRDTVTKVNKDKVHVSGFENGRYLFAYRYVYPLSYMGEHVGSVELAVGMDELLQAMYSIYGTGYSYLMEKISSLKTTQQKTSKSIRSYRSLTNTS